MDSLAGVLKVLSERYSELIKVSGFDLEDVWSRVAGETVSSVSRPERVSDGCLFVIVKDSVWLAQLNLLKGEIIDSINKELGKDAVKDIKFRVGRIKAGSASARPKTSSDNIRYKKAPDEILDKINDIVENVEDKDIKRMLKEIMKLSYLAAAAKTPNP